MNVSHITVSFLNYGPETGGQRCMVAMARALGDQVKGMVFQITGAGNQASFQSIFSIPGRHLLFRCLGTQIRAT